MGEEGRGGGGGRCMFVYIVVCMWEVLFEHYTELVLQDLLQP